MHKRILGYYNRYTNRDETAFRATTKEKCEMKGKVIRLALLCFVMGAVFTVTGYAEIDLKDCIGIWLFDEGNGGTAGDISDNKNDGKITGAKWENGKFGKALDFDGIDDRVDILDSDSLNGLKEITILAWVYLRREVTSGTWNSLAGKNPYPNGYLMWIQVPREPCGLVYAGGTRFDNRTAVQIDLKKWYHLAFTRDEKGEMKFYIDGALITTALSTAGPISTIAGPLSIAGQSPQTLDGLIDEVVFFNTVLSVDDIKNIMTRGLNGATAVTNSGKLVTTWAYIKN